MASLMGDSDDDELLQPSFAFKPLNVTSDMVDSVLAVCPDASREVITADLYYTSSAATTINRILDGLNIEVCLDPALLSTKEARDGNVNPIIEKLTSLGVSYSLQTHPVPESITWKRAAVEHTIGEDCQIHKQKTLTDETHVLVHLATDLFISMVDTFKKTRHGCSGSDTSSHSIESFRRTLSNAYDKKTISLVITGLNKYFRDIKSQKARQYRNAVRGEADDMENTKSRNKVSSPSSIVSQVDVEEFLVFVELTTELKLTLCETMQDFADNVSMVTKAIAEAPFKRSQPQAFSFCVDSSKSSVKVTKDGNGLIKLWQQQLQQFHNVSSNMAAAIVAAYPSPQLLIEAYKECSNKHSATLLLKDILVRLSYIHYVCSVSSPISTMSALCSRYVSPISTMSALCSRYVVVQVCWPLLDALDLNYRAKFICYLMRLMEKHFPNN
ncbi:hypothetical protein QZH41_017466 [Actinostola sp. cb2023]|nr:hypothetical protein QZH41_017466 [Actinostola sp. cb2023]